MSLFERIKEKRISLNEQIFSDKQKSDMKKLLNKNFGSKEISKKTADTQKNLSKANKEVFNVTGKSAVRDAKKYSSGEYPKIGGGTRIGSKSKGTGAETGAKVNLNPKSGSKSKGNTPVKVNITKPIKQSEVSKKAKVFTQKIDKKKIIKDADRLVRKAEKGDKKARKKILKTVTKKFKKLSPADQQIQLTKMADIQKKMGRTLNPKTGNFEGPDTKFQKDISKIKGSKTGKRITSGPVSVTAGPKIKKRVETIRDTRATKAGMPDPFKSKTKVQTNFDDIFKGVKKTKKFKLGGKTQFDVSKTKLGKIELPPKKISPEVQKKSISDFKKKISDATKQTVSQDKKFKTLRKKLAKLVSSKGGTVTKVKKLPKTSSQLEIGFGGTPGSKPIGGSKTVKQSEVSKKAKDFTQKINQKKTTNTAQKMSTVKGDPLQGNVDYDTSTKSTPKPTPKPKKPNVFKRVTAATSGKKVTNSKGTGNQFRGPENKVAKDARIKLDRSASGMGGGKPPKPPTVKGGTLGFPEPGDTPKLKRVVTKQTRALQSAQGKFAKSAVGKGIRKNLPQVYKGVRSLGPAGRAFAKTGVIGGAATIGTAFLAKNLLKKAAIGGVGGGILGGLAASQKMSDKERIKKNLPAKFVKDKDGKEIKTVSKMSLNLSDYSKKTKKLKPRTSTSLQGSADYAGKVKNIPAYGAKYTG